MEMGHKKNNDKLRIRRHLDRLEWETAEELGLEGKHFGRYEGIAGRERKVEKFLVKKAETALVAEGRRKTELNL